MMDRDGLQSTIALGHGQVEGEGGSFVLGDSGGAHGGRSLASCAGVDGPGYTSWRECVVAEFKDQQRYLYYQLEAAQTEKNICTIVQKRTDPRGSDPSLDQTAR